MTTEIVKAGGALAIRPDQTEWTPAQKAVLQQSGISNDVTAAELSGFLHLCQRTQLDPFSRQIYLIGRNDKREGRKVFTPQTGIDGYRVIAHRVIAESGDQFGYEDTLWCDNSGRWHDVWLAAAPPAAAKVTVLRNGQKFSAVALFREYAQTWDGTPTGMWAKMPSGQIAKCAEALALRKAFPHDLAGVYTAEEMAQADNPAPTVEQQSPTRPLRSVPTEPEQPQRDFLHEARQAKTADEVRQIWLDANAFGSYPEYLEQIAEVGRQKAAQSAPAAKPAPKAEPETVDAELVDEPQPEERTAALDELRAVAVERGFAADLEANFRSSYGTTPDEASIEQLRDCTAMLRAAA